MTTEKSPFQYPIPGTNAEKVLGYIAANPGISTNGISEALSLNPTVARKCLVSLISHGKIVDKPNKAGHHAYSLA